MQIHCSISKKLTDPDVLVYIDGLDVAFAWPLLLVLGGLAGTPTEASVEVPQIIRESDAFD